MTIRTDIRDVIEEVTGKKFPEILDDEDLANIVADSLEHVELVIGLEDKFDIIIEDAEADTLKTFGDLVKAVQGRKQQ